MNLKPYNEFKEFILDLKELINDKYLFEIIYEVKEGYFNLINNIDKINIDNIKDKKNISDISLFIYPKNTDKFIGYNKFNNINNSKTFTFLSSPLSNIDEFTKNTIEKIKESKYIYGESLEGIKNFLNNLNITYNDKKLFNGDDIEIIKSYIINNDLKISEEFLLVGIIDLSKTLGFSLEKIFIHGDEKHLKNNIDFDLGNLELEYGYNGGSNNIDLFITNSHFNGGNDESYKKMQFGFPSYDYHVYTYEPYFGYKGALIFINRIGNILNSLLR